MSLYEKKRARTAIPHFDKVVHCHYAIFPFFRYSLFFILYIILLFCVAEKKNDLHSPTGKSGLSLFLCVTCKVTQQKGKAKRRKEKKKKNLKITQKR